MNAPLKGARTGDVLISTGVVTRAGIELALEAQRRQQSLGHSIKIGEVIVRLGLADREDVERAIQRTGNKISGFEQINLPPTVAKRLKVMPVAIRDKTLYYAPYLPLTAAGEAELLEAAQSEGHEVDSVRVSAKSRAEIEAWLKSLTYVDAAEVQREADQLCRDSHDGMLMTSFIQHIFQEALQLNASDVHFERSSDMLLCWIGYRVDGLLRRKINLTTEAMTAVCTKLKTLSNIDISEKRSSLDGRYAIEYSGRKIDLRFGFVPNENGEKIVVRLLDRAVRHKVSYLFRRHPAVAERLHALTRGGSKLGTGGIVLVTGPTGQGKSTSLAALLTDMRRVEMNIMTIEDPVESEVPLAFQLAVNPTAGMTYAKVMRAYMRQDPDVIMVGEIRDGETAEEFLKGAQTGHLMLATEHTNDVASAIGRLLNLIADEIRRAQTFTAAAHLRAVINQRLVPALCQQCAEPHPEAFGEFPQLFAMLGYEPSHQSSWKVRRAVGCSVCGQTGYRGRELVAEAAFFPSATHVQAGVEHALLNHSPAAVLDVEGVWYYSRMEAIRVLLASGLIDATTAEMSLDLSLVRHE